jgi:hypothetical protein
MMFGMASSQEPFGELLDEPHTLDISLLNDETMLIEADRASLAFLGKLLIALAEDDDECTHFSIGPRSAGSAHFDAQSRFGLYLHALPCVHGSANGSGIAT